MSTSTEINTFKATYSIRFGGLPHELKDAALLPVAADKIDKAIDRVGISACVKAIESMEWDDGKYSKPPTLGRVLSECYSAGKVAGQTGCHECGYTGIFYHYTTPDGMCSPYMHSNGYISAAKCPYCFGYMYKSGWSDKDGKHPSAPRKMAFLKEHGFKPPFAEEFERLHCENLTDEDYSELAFG